MLFLQFEKTPETYDPQFVASTAIAIGEICTAFIIAESVLVTDVYPVMFAYQAETELQAWSVAVYG